jgi:hypothetical protein
MKIIQNKPLYPVCFKAFRFGMSVPLLALLLSWLACLHARAAVQTVTIPNDTGQVANNLEIAFSQPLDVGLQNSKTTANPFTTVALNGLSPNEYTFRGATVAPGGSATVSWSPVGGCYETQTGNP